MHALIIAGEGQQTSAVTAAYSGYKSANYPIKLDIK